MGDVMRTLRIAAIRDTNTITVKLDPDADIKVDGGFNFDSIVGLVLY